MKTWILAVSSGLFVAMGTTFVGVALPFAFGLVPLGVGLFWLILPASLAVGMLLGVANARRTLRMHARHPREPSQDTKS